LGNNQARKTEIKKTQNKEKSEKFSVFHLVERRQNKEKSENPELERDKEIESYRIMHKDGRRRKPKNVRRKGGLRRERERQSGAGQRA